MSLELSRRLIWVAMALLLCASLRAFDDQADVEVFEPGGPVRAPKLIHYVEPEFSTSSKEAFVEGTVKISTVVTLEGLASKCKIVSGLNSEEDQTAMEALKKWRFKPGTKDGKPVNVHVNVEVAFHLL